MVSTFLTSLPYRRSWSWSRVLPQPTFVGDNCVTSTWEATLWRDVCFYLRYLFFNEYLKRLCHGFLFILLILPMTITRYMELSVSEEITCKWENHNFASKKYVSQTSYQALQTTKMNVEKLLNQQFFKNHIAIKLSSVPFCVLAVFTVIYTIL